MPLALHVDVSLAETENGIVLLHERLGRYWQLNQTGSTILRRLLDGYTPARVARNLARDYLIPETRAAADVDALLDALCLASLVTK